MGQTLASISQVFHNEEQAMTRFKQALRSSDQIALAELFNSAQHHLSAAAYAAHLTPMEIFLVAMLLEEHKKTKNLQEKITSLEQQLGFVANQVFEKMEG